MRNAAIAVLLLIPTTAFAEFKVGDKVLAARGRTNSFYVATVKTSSELEGGSVTFLDGTVQTYGPITFAPSLHAFDWKVGSQLECATEIAVAAKAPEAGDGMTKGAVTSIDDATVELDKKTKFPLAGCRYHRTWWDELSVEWRDYAKYATVKAFPKRGAAQPAADEVRSAMSDFLSGADGGSYIQIKKCVAIGKAWVKQNSGSELTARSIDVACGIAIPLPPKPQENFTCLVEYGVCRQPYQGDGQFGGCEWKGAGRDPEQIKCAALK